MMYIYLKTIRNTTKSDKVDNVNIGDRGSKSLHCIASVSSLSEVMVFDITKVWQQCMSS